MSHSPSLPGLPLLPPQSQANLEEDGESVCELARAEQFTIGGYCLLP